MTNDKRQQALLLDAANRMRRAANYMETGRILESHTAALEGLSQMMHVVIEVVQEVKETLQQIIEEQHNAQRP